MGLCGTKPRFDFIDVALLMHYLAVLIGVRTLQFDRLVANDASPLVR